MFRSQPLRIVVVVLLVVVGVAVVWLRMDLSAPKQPLLTRSPSWPSDMRSHALTELMRLGEAVERLRIRAEDGTEHDVLHATREDVRTRAAELLRLEVVEQSPSQVASAIAAVRRDTGNSVAGPDSSWKPLLQVGKVLSLRAEAMMVSEGPDAAWRQVLQGFDYSEALYRSASSLSQVALARSVQGFFARTVSTAIAARAWPPAVLVQIAKRRERLQLGPLLLRGIEHEYTSALAMAMAESGASPVLIRRVLYQPNRTEGLWSKTLVQAVRALSEDKPVVAYRLATSTPPVREQVPIFWRNWLGYKFSVPAIQSCIDAMFMIVNAELQMQLLELAANMGRYHAEIGELPPSLEVLVKRFPDTDIQDPWLEGNAPLRYDAGAGVVYSVGANRTDEHVPAEQSFDTSPTSDDYRVRLVP